MLPTSFAELPLPLDALAALNAALKSDMMSSVGRTSRDWQDKMTDHLLTQLQSQQSHRSVTLPLCACSNYQQCSTGLGLSRVS